MSEADRPEAADAGPPDCRDLPPALGLLAAFLLLYLITLCPTVYLGDSGEIALAISQGGIVHPPGYPLFTLLGRLAIALIPFGEVAFRVGCVTAAAAALTVASLYWLAREIGTGRLAAAMTASMLGVSFTFWSQATRVEMYSLHTFLVTLAFIGAVRYRRRGCLSCLALTALAGSLGLAHHLTIVLIAPALLLLCGQRLWRDPGLGRRLAVTLPLLLIGPSLYLLLMISASADPLHCWGRPTNLALLWNHVSARIYRSALQPPEWWYYSARAAQAWGIFRSNFGWLGLPLAFAGALLLRRNDPHLAPGFLLGAAAVTAYAQIYRIADIAPYYLSAVLLLILLAGVALQHAADRVQPLRRVFFTAFGALFIAWPLYANWSGCDLGRATWVRDFARQKLESTEPGSLLFTHEDPDTFPIWYVRHVLRIRPDVTPVDYGITRNQVRKYDLDPSQWYLHTLRKQGLPAPLDYPKDAESRRRLDQEAWIFKEIMRLAADRPIYTTFLLPPNRNHTFFTWLKGEYAGVPVGLVLKLQPVHEPLDLNALLARNRQLWAGFKLPEIGGLRLEQDMYPAYTINHYACMLVNYGNLYERLGRLEEAKLVYNSALQFAPGYRPARRALDGVDGGESPEQAAPPAPFSISQTAPGVEE